MAEVLSKLLTSDEFALVKEVLGPKKTCLACAVAQLYLALPDNRTIWKLTAMGVVCLVKDGTKRSYYIRIVNMDKGEISWEQELYKQFKYRAATSFFHTFNAHDCRAGLNFCDEQESQAFRAAIKERIKAFKQKREEARARKMMAQQQMYMMAAPTAYVPHPSGKGMQVVHLQAYPSVAGGMMPVQSQMMPYPGGMRQMAVRGKGGMMMQPQMSMMRPQMSSMMRPQMSAVGSQMGPPMRGRGRARGRGRGGIGRGASRAGRGQGRQVSGLAAEASPAGPAVEPKAVPQQQAAAVTPVPRPPVPVPDAVPPSGKASPEVPAAKEKKKKEKKGGFFSSLFGTKKKAESPARPQVEAPTPVPSISPPISGPVSTEVPPAPAPAQALPAAPPLSEAPPPPPLPGSPAAPPPPPPPPGGAVMARAAPAAPIASPLAEGPPTPPTVTGGMTIQSPCIPPPPPAFAAPPPPPPPPPPPMLAAAPPAPSSGNSVLGALSSAGGGGSLMDSILAGTQLKKVDRSQQLKPKSSGPEGGMGGALARAMDMRSKVMHSSDEDDDDDDDDWDDDEDDDEWSD